MEVILAQRLDGAAVRSAKQASQSRRTQSHSSPTWAISTGAVQLCLTEPRPLYTRMHCSTDEGSCPLHSALSHCLAQKHVRKMRMDRAFRLSVYIIGETRAQGAGPKYDRCATASTPPNCQRQEDLLRDCDAVLNSSSPANQPGQLREPLAIGRSRTLGTTMNLLVHPKTVVINAREHNGLRERSTRCTRSSYADVAQRVLN